MKKLLLLLSLVASKALAVEVSQEWLNARATAACSFSPNEVSEHIHGNAYPDCSMLKKMLEEIENRALLSASQYGAPPLSTEYTNIKSKTIDTLLTYFATHCMQNNKEMFLDCDNPYAVQLAQVLKDQGHTFSALQRENARTAPQRFGYLSFKARGRYNEACGRCKEVAEIIDSAS
jgi:hypothetical protein